MKMRIVWLCHFSNKLIRDHLTHKYTFIDSLGKNVPLFSHLFIPKDSGQWNSNGIKQFENNPDIELHVVLPEFDLSKQVIEFQNNGVYYHIYNNQYGRIRYALGQKLGKILLGNYLINRKIVSEIITQINPHIVHVMGAENPYYSYSTLDIPESIPTIVHLQTLMMADGFKENYPISTLNYHYRVNIEKKVLRRADYIVSNNKKNCDKITQFLRYEPSFLKLRLFIDEVDLSETKKSYDFVYFSKDISKACDLAIEAFSIAKQKIPSITLLVVGGFDEKYKHSLDSRIFDLKLSDSITFTGNLETHDDVIRCIKKARFALLPLKIDYIAGTIRESIQNGLPVISTITEGTPSLNKKRKSVLLSEIGNHEALAENIVKLYNDKILQEELKQNGLLTIDELYGNKHSKEQWKDAYTTILRNFRITKNKL